jgi:hypothetical protein
MRKIGIFLRKIRPKGAIEPYSGRIDIGIAIGIAREARFGELFKGWKHDFSIPQEPIFAKV